jgi:predicted nucleic acid-binding protein
MSARDALSPPEALALLSENLAHDAHDFWAETLSVPDALDGLEAELRGHQQFMDAYLLAVAHAEWD